jgi:uncharacterized membrane protein
VSGDVSELPRAPPAFGLHNEARATLDAPIDVAFAYLDDFRQLSFHMENPSKMMLGSKMTIETDGADGRAMGSRVRMVGKVLGLRLNLEEIVIERDPPTRKVWQTVDANLLVIGLYRLGFELDPLGDTTNVRVFIDYDLPERWPWRWFGRLLGRVYARWCVEQMARDAKRRFPQLP